MKNIIVSIALATSALVAAAPAVAQYDSREERYDRRDQDDRYDRRDDRWDDRDDRRGDDRYVVEQRFQRNGALGQQLDRISFQISRSIQNGRLSQGEGRQLQVEHRNLWRLAQRYYASGGLTGWERADLQRRVNYLQQRVRTERQDNDRRPY